MMSNRNHAVQYLRTALNKRNADFRDGQWESIEQLLQRRRVLVVQRTGWGKSMVYFLATKLLREQGAGPTLLISPLLSLMRNQIEAAQRMGVTAVTINSTNNAEWQQIANELAANRVDVLLISPERLANDEFRQNVLGRLASNIGMLVVDEAHCISDWGHDFRPDYRRIVRILQALPQNIPVLATTATANDRVVNDVQSQLGSNIVLQRGSLVRESLKLQNISMPSPSARMAWMAETIPNLPSSGIVYALTQRDAERVAEWLRITGIKAQVYHDLVSATRASLGNCVPSLNHPKLVPDFAEKLAGELGLPFIECVTKIRDSSQQKLMENSFQQVKNLDGVFQVSDQCRAEPCLLIDDVIDSGWTFTVLAALLGKAGCSAVFPLALALNSPRMD